MEKPNTIPAAPAAPVQLPPLEALKNLALVADDHPLRVKERDLINLSIRTLHQLIQSYEELTAVKAPDPK